MHWSSSELYSAGAEASEMEALRQPRITGVALGPRPADALVVGAQLQNGHVVI